MKNFGYLLIIFLACCGIVPSCSRTDGADTEKGGELRFYERISATVHTRAVAVESMQSFSVVAWKAGTCLWSGTASLSGSDYATGRVWEESDRGAAFYASNATIHTDAATPYISYNRSSYDQDVIVASNASPTWGVRCPLEFSHILTRIGTLSVVPSGDFTVSGVTAKILLPRTVGTYSFDGTWSALSGAEYEAVSAGANNIWLIPGTYTLDISYTLTGDLGSMPCHGTAEITLDAGDVNNITATVGETVSVTVSASVDSWTRDETNYDYSTEVTLASDGQLAWQSGTYTSAGTFRVILSFGVDLEGDFHIDTPEGSVWYALLETKSGDGAAFQFVDKEGNLSDSAHGPVGEAAHIRIRQTDPYPAVQNSAEFSVVVRAGGRNIPVAGLVDNYGHSWTIVQNANN